MLFTVEKHPYKKKQYKVQTWFSDIKFSDNSWFSDYFTKTIFNLLAIYYMKSFNLVTLFNIMYFLQKDDIMLHFTLSGSSDITGCQCLLRKLVTLCNLVRVFVEDKSVTELRLLCTCFYLFVPWGLVTPLQHQTLQEHTADYLWLILQSLLTTCTRQAYCITFAWFTDSN